MKCLLSVRTTVTLMKEKAHGYGKLYFEEKSQAKDDKDIKGKRIAFQHLKIASLHVMYTYYKGYLSYSLSTHTCQQFGVSTFPPKVPRWDPVLNHWKPRADTRISFAPGAYVT